MTLNEAIEALVAFLDEMPGSVAAEALRIVLTELERLERLQPVD